MTLQDEALAGSFPQASEDQWRKAVERALKGGTLDKLVAKTYDGAAINPLYRRAEAPGPRSLRVNPGRWAILARVDIADSEAANAQALEDLEGGADGLHLVFAGSQGAYGAALNDDGDPALAHVLDKVRLDYGIPVMVEDSPRAPNAAEAIMRKQGIFNAAPAMRSDAERQADVAAGRELPEASSEGRQEPQGDSGFSHGSGLEARQEAADSSSP